MSVLPWLEGKDNAATMQSKLLSGLKDATLITVLNVLVWHEVYAATGNLARMNVSGFRRIGLDLFLETLCRWNIRMAMVYPDVRLTGRRNNLMF